MHPLIRVEVVVRSTDEPWDMTLDLRISGDIRFRSSRMMISKSSCRSLAPAPYNGRHDQSRPQTGKENRDRVRRFGHDGMLPLL